MGVSSRYSTKYLSGKFTKFRSIAGCVYTPGGKFSIIEFGLEKAVRYYYYLLQYHIVRSKLHKTMYNFLKANREPNRDIPELLLVRDPPGSRSTEYRPTGVPNRLQELYINRKIQFTRTANCVRAARDLNL